MRKEYRYFDIFPRIVQANHEQTIYINPRFGHSRGLLEKVNQVIVQPQDGEAGQMTWSQPEPVPFERTETGIRFTFFFDREQEYSVLLQSDPPDRSQTAVEFRLYALENDLFQRRPYKGDFHAHSSYSDGWESPAYVAACSRKVGMDFMAVTDHHQYAPSLEAIRAFEDSGADLRIYPGEEVHPPGNPVHMVNFGGRFSINMLFTGDDYRQGVQEIAERLSDLPQDIDRYPYASCVWCFEKIRQADGLGIFCHPYWISRHRNDVPASLTDLLFERQPYDALELIGGYLLNEVESNTLQVARYQEERAKGKRIPIVGASDSHGFERNALVGWYYTVVFSPSADLPDLIQSIIDLNSVAVEALPGETPRAFGPLRVAKLTLYLMREVFPEHDELCEQEGQWMLAYAGGDGQAAGRLRAENGRTRALYDHIWGTLES